MRYRFAVPLFLALTLGIVFDLSVRIHHLSVGAQAQASGAPERVDAIKIAAPLGAQSSSESEVMPHDAHGPTLGDQVNPQSNPTGGIDPKEMASSSPDPKDMKELIVSDVPITAPSNADFGKNGANHGIPLPIEGGKVPTAPAAVPESGVGISLCAGIICLLMGKR